MGLVASIRGEKSHDIIRKGLEVLINLTHRGAAGCDPETGDGAGILIQIPHVFFARECGELGMQLPAAGAYGVAMCFLPVDRHSRLQCEGVFERISAAEGLKVLGWRDTPVNGDAIGREARAIAALHRAVLRGPARGHGRGHFRAPALLVRRRTENEMAASDIEGKEEFFYIPSFSCRTIIYKGLMLAPQIEKFYFELANPLRHQRAVPGSPALLHQHLPELEAGAPVPLRRAQRRNQHHPRQHQLDERAPVACSTVPLFGEDINKLFPVIMPGGSDSASLDNAVEFLFQSGRSLPHVMAMLIPEAWAGNPDMDEDKRAFYEYHASLMEPWDGPAAIAFTDGRVIGATLDRNGLRPGRYIVTKDDLVVLASEAGVLDVPARGHSQEGPPAARPHVPGRHRAEAHHLRRRDQEAARRAPALCASGCKQQQVTLDQLPEPSRVIASESRDAAAPPARLRLQRRRSAHPACAHGAQRARSRSAPWAPTRRWPASPTRRSRCSTTSSSCSRR